ncbi:MAG: hypothetical protein JRH15_12765 [Deltaproteobacteria bacterium]|nr:hypothetical protein [Deltaproteobacteria bacterium]
MKRMNPDHPGLKNAFRAVFKERDRQPVPEVEIKTGQWEAKIMRRIRLAASSPADTGFGFAAWRLAPVTCGLLVLLCVWLIHLDPGSGYEYAALSLDDPVGYQFWMDTK